MFTNTIYFIQYFWNHDFLPDDFMKTEITQIAKNKNKDMSDINCPCQNKIILGVDNFRTVVVNNR